MLVKLQNLSILSFCVTGVVILRSLPFKAWSGIATVKYRHATFHQAHNLFVSTFDVNGLFVKWLLSDFYLNIGNDWSASLTSGGRLFYILYRHIWSHTGTMTWSASKPRYISRDYLACVFFTSTMSMYIICTQYYYGCS